MKTRFDPEPDFRRTVDGLEPVRLVARGGSGLGWTADAKRTGERLGDAKDGEGEGAIALWRIDDRNLRRSPGVGDELIDRSGHRWRVLEVQRALGGVRHACRCRDLTQAGLLERATLYVGEPERGALGEGTTRWVAKAAGVAVRLERAASGGGEAVLEPDAATNAEKIRLVTVGGETWDGIGPMRTAPGRLPRIAVRRAAAE